MDEERKKIENENLFESFSDLKKVHKKLQSVKKIILKICAFLQSKNDENCVKHLAKAGNFIKSF